MSDVRVEQKQSLSRQEAARFLARLAEGLGEDGKVTVELGGSTLELSVADQLRCEFEVDVDGDEIELELELKWSTSGRASAEPVEQQPSEDASEATHRSGTEEVAADTPADEPPASGEVPLVGAVGVESEQAAAPEEAAKPERAAKPARGRRRATARTAKPASDAIDTAAVRAWAAANKLTVSPRGRIKDDVIQAYRDAGN